MIGLEGERLIPVDATHSEICKFSSATDPCFTLVLAQIKKCASLAVSDSKRPTMDQGSGNTKLLSLSTIS
jgi:hypothetical protein